MRRRALILFVRFLLFISTDFFFSGIAMHHNDPNVTCRRAANGMAVRAWHTAIAVVKICCQQHGDVKQLSSQKLHGRVHAMPPQRHRNTAAVAGAALRWRPIPQPAPPQLPAPQPLATRHCPRPGTCPRPQAERSGNSPAERPRRGGGACGAVRTQPKPRSRERLQSARHAQSRGRWWRMQ